MAGFFREWRRLLVAPVPTIGGWATLCKFLGSAFVAGLLTPIVGAFGHIPGWTLPFIAFVVFYLSLTAGMAWERRGPFVEIGPLRLDEPMRIFFVDIKNGPIPVTQVELKIQPVYDSLGTKHTGRSWQGHWRHRLQTFDGELSAYEEAEYGLLGVSSFQVSGHPNLLIYSRELMSENRFPTISRDAPLEQQGTTKLDVVVNCKTQDGKSGKPMVLTFYIDPDPKSPLGYTARTEEMATTSTVWVNGGHEIRWYFDRFLTAVERVFGHPRNPPP